MLEKGGFLSHWTVSLIQLVSPMLNKIYYPKEVQIKNYPLRYLILIFIRYMYTCAYSSTQTCAYTIHTTPTKQTNKTTTNTLIQYKTKRKISLKFEGIILVLCRIYTQKHIYRIKASPISLCTPTSCCFISQSKLSVVGDP